MIEMSLRNYMALRMRMFSLRKKRLVLKRQRKEAPRYHWRLVVTLKKVIKMIM
jgi:hypothetical protein